MTSETTVDAEVTSETTVDAEVTSEMAPETTVSAETKVEQTPKIQETVEQPQRKAESPMKRIYLDKVVLNMGMGRSGDAINIAKRALEQITGKKPCARDAHDSQRDWGVRKGEPIGVSVTVRGQDARVLLKRLLDAKGNAINGRSFDDFGNYSFGIREHIDIPGVKYEPQIGILGLGVSVALARPGYSIRKRSKHKASVGKTHIITNTEAKNYIVSEFEVQVI